MNQDNVLQIEIPEEITLMAQKYDLEASTRKEIIIYLLSHTDIDINEERFAQYQADYDEKKFSFEVTKQEIEKEFILPKVNNKKCHWKLDYGTNIITITLEE